jgi:hypothetical protein
VSPLPEPRLRRRALALILISYAFSKLNGARFTVFDAELERPMGGCPASG